MRPIALGVLLGVVVASGARDACGACPDAGHDWISVEFDNARPIGRMESERQRLQQRVVEHLQAEFRPQHIDVCASPVTASSTALATLRIERDASNEAFVRAWANDAVTQKELGRRLSLEGLPKDAHALAIALLASELLHASWVELRLESSSRVAMAAPPSVEQAVKSHEKTLQTVGDLGISLGAEAFSGGLRQAGIDGRVTLTWNRHLETNVRVGGRRSMSASSTHGSVSADGWLAGVGTNLVVARPSPALRLLFLASADAMWVTFSGVAGANASATSSSDVACWGTLGLGTDVRLSRDFTVDGGVLAGQVFRPIVAADNGKRVLGLTEGLVAAHVGIKIRF